VISNPEKVHPEDVAYHLQEPNPGLVLLLVSEEDKPSGGVLNGFPPAQTKTFSLPAFYKLDEYAADYARELTRARGVDLPDGLARALVKKVGNDLGVISFEIDKVLRLVGGVKVLEPVHFRGTIAALSELDGGFVADALGTRNVKLLSDELFRYKTSKRGDPTIELCGRTLTPTVFKWLQAAYLHTKEMSIMTAAGRVSASPWYWENKVLPCAKNWGVEGCQNLLSVVAKAQTAVFEGAINPWGILSSGVLKLAR
jgi:DNA polymerase III delta subunit